MNKPTQTQSSPAADLRSSVSGGDLEAVQFALANGADAKEQDAAGNTLLHLAVSNVKNIDDLTLARTLLEAGADPAEINADGLLPEQMAGLQSPAGVWMNMARVNQVVVNADPSLNLCTPQGWSGLHVAAHKGDTQDVVRRIEAGARVDLKEENGHTPLCIAIECGHVETVDALIGRQPSWEFTRTRARETVLHLAAHRNRKDVVRLLLERSGENKKWLVCERNNQERTALHLAAVSIPFLESDPSLAQILVDAGAEVNAQDDGGNTALTLAAQDGRAGVCKVLLDAGAQEYLASEEGACYSPLGDAATAVLGSCETVAVILPHQPTMRKWEADEVEAILNRRIASSEYSDEEVVEMRENIATVRKAAGLSGKPAPAKDSAESAEMAP